MALVAYGVGRLTLTEWVWWLAPLTVAVDGSFLLRVRLSDSTALLSPLEVPVVADLGASGSLAAFTAAAGMAIWGAYSGSRLALIMGAALALLGNALQECEEATLGSNTTEPD